MTEHCSLNRSGEIFIRHRIIKTFFYRSILHLCTYQGNKSEYIFLFVFSNLISIQSNIANQFSRVCKHACTNNQPKSVAGSSSLKTSLLKTPLYKGFCNGQNERGNQIISQYGNAVAKLGTCIQVPVAKFETRIHALSWGQL